jgi:hypothetical protein
MATPRKPRPPRVPPEERVMTVAAHPRAAHAVRRAKGAGGLVGLVLAALLSHSAGLPAADVGLRALLGGIAGYLVFWVVAVEAARHLVVAEARAAGESADEPLEESGA